MFDMVESDFDYIFNNLLAVASLVATVAFGFAFNTGLSKRREVAQIREKTGDCLDYEPRWSISN